MGIGNRPNAGQLRNIVRFERERLADDGTPTGDWRPFHTAQARIARLAGGEDVIGQRLEGRQMIAITLRAGAVVSQLTSADRVVELATGQVFDLKTIDPDAWPTEAPRAWADVTALSRAGGTPG